MVLLQDLSERLQADDPEQRQTISGVSWQGYEALLNDLGDLLQKSQPAREFIPCLIAQFG